MLLLQDTGTHCFKRCFRFFSGPFDGTPIKTLVLCNASVRSPFLSLSLSDLRRSLASSGYRRQLVQSAGFVRGNHVPPTSRGGHTKHFFRMANRGSSTPMASKQARFFVARNHPDGAGCASRPRVVVVGEGCWLIVLPAKIGRVDGNFLLEE